MKENIIKGTLGTVIPILAALTPGQIEMGLRMASAGLGCIVGILTIIGLIRRWNK